MKLSIVHKLSFSAALLALICTGTIGSLFYYKTTDLLVEHALEDIKKQNHNAATKLLTHIDTLQDDVLLLSETPPIQNILKANKIDYNNALRTEQFEVWAQRLQSIFSAMLGSKPNYIKIRYIDKNGKEMVVVGRESNGIEITQQPQLQNKSHRQYVQATLKLESREVYLSEINLNREYNKITVPRQEVLRAATPIYDQSSNKIAGLIVVTSEIGQSLRTIQKIIQNEDSDIYITNDRGSYLLHPDASKTYGFDLGVLYRIQTETPLLSRLFDEQNTENTITLLPGETGGKHVINFSKIAFDRSNPERFITIGTIQQYNNIIKKQSEVLNNVIIIALVLAILVTSGAVAFAYQLSRPIKLITQVMDDYTNHGYSSLKMPINKRDEIGFLARSYEALVHQVEEGKKSLQEINVNLEELVAERTKKLELSELQQRSIVENIADGLITINTQGCILSFNATAERIFGYEADEVIGENVNILMPEPYHSDHNSYLENYHKTGIKKVIGVGREAEGQRKDGSIFPLDLAVSEMFVGDERLYTGLVRDITERKLIEKMKSEFVSTVSHELRTPLTAIRGSLGLITGGAVGQVSDDVNQMLSIAGNNTQRLLLLINDILDIQKIESGQMDFTFQELSLMPFLEQVITDNKSYGDEYGVTFILNKGINDAYLFVDKDRLMQVMVNLLSNAAKFSPKGSQVEIGAMRKNHNVIRISITDHGPGIPEVFQPKLFEKFTQSDSSDTRLKGGTGLGLSISKVIIEKLGGTIDFVSHEGSGTSFFIDLNEMINKAQA